jgi:ferredoxin
MLVIDPEECIDTAACEPECPVEAIFRLDAVPQEWQPYVWVNAAVREGKAAVEAELAAVLGDGDGDLHRSDHDPVLPIETRRTR